MVVSTANGVWSMFSVCRELREVVMGWYYALYDSGDGRS